MVNGIAMSTCLYSLMFLKSEYSKQSSNLLAIANSHKFKNQYLNLHDDFTIMITWFYVGNKSSLLILQENK